MDSLNIDRETAEIVMDADLFAPPFVSENKLSISSRRGIVSPNLQRTLLQPISCTGIGLHSGKHVTLSIEPANAGTGIVFHRSDLNGAPIPARFDNVIDTRLSTVIAAAGDTQNRVATIEHLMAALHGCGIDNARITVDGPETPVLDGSAADFVFLIECAGTCVLDAPRRVIEVLKPVRAEEGDAFAQLMPASGRHLTLAMSIDFAASAIGRQSFSMRLDAANFRQELSRCRTFTLRQEIEALHRAGLARGGSLDNAIVVDGDQVLNPTGLRHRDEFVRHKMMDAVGDLYLAGAQLRGRFTGHKSGHGLNNKLLRTLFADASAWRWSDQASLLRPQRAAA